MADRWLAAKREKAVGRLRVHLTNFGLALIHFSSLALAYAVMLFIMTYSVELSVCALAGLVLGRFFTLRISRRVPGLSGLEGDGGGAAPCCNQATFHGVLSPTEGKRPASRARE